jgi:predicted nucleic acid-binding protein
MSYLLDTNIISETLRPEPHPKLIEWLKTNPSEAFHISVLTLGEIRKGVEKLPVGAKKTKILSWLEYDLVNWLDERVLPVDEVIADRWGYLCATTPNLPAIDGLLAATALCHNLKMVTRNTKDFFVPGLEVLNPFE